VFAGWAPVELHEHYDVDGALTGSTVVTRESEWDDTARARAEALLLVEDTSCNKCGGDLNRSLQRGPVYDVDTDTVCYSCAALELVEREEGTRHENDKPFPGRQMYMDGRIYTVREIEPPKE
jgi:hypothetical protein